MRIPETWSGGGSTLPARASGVALVVLLLVLLPLAGGESGTDLTREVRRTVASPFPVGPADALSDEVQYRVDVPLGVVVCVSARDVGPALFWLRASDGRTTLGSPNPALEQGLLLPAGSWTLSIDPALGANVDILVDLAGHYVDCGNEAASFSVVDLPSPPPCVTPAGACLP